MFIVMPDYDGKFTNSPGPGGTVPFYGPFETEEEIKKISWDANWYDFVVIELTKPPKNELDILKERTVQLGAELQEKEHILRERIAQLEAELQEKERSRPKRVKKSLSSILPRRKMGRNGMPSLESEIGKTFQWLRGRSSGTSSDAASDLNMSQNRTSMYLGSLYRKGLADRMRIGKSFLYSKKN